MAIRFSAADQHFTATTGLVGNVYTFTGWVWATSVGTRYRVMYWYRQSSNDNFTGIGIRDNPTNLQMIGDVNYWFNGVGPTPAATQTWYRVAAVVNGANATFYQSTAGGSLVAASVSNFSPPASPNQLWLGADPYGGWWDGRFAAVKVWTAALSAAEVEAELSQYAPRRSANLLRWHPFVRAETTDYSGNGFHLSGGTGTTTEDGPPIPWGSAVPLVVRPAAAGSPIPVTVSGAAGTAMLRPGAGIVAAAVSAPMPGKGGAVRVRASAGAVLGEQVAAVSGGPGSVRLHGAPGGVATVQQAFPAAGGGRVVIRASAGAVSTAVGGTSVTVGGRAGGVLLRAAQATVLAVQEQPVTGAPGALTVRPGAGAVLAVQRQTPAGVAGVVRLSAGSARVLAVQSAVPAGAAGVIRVRGGAGALAGPVTVVLQGTAASIWCRPGRGSVLAGGTPTVTRGAMTAAARTGAQAVRRERAGARMGGR